ncbi:alkaline phosphatase family protein [Amycolatopsis benzoatilytica]|uniref:alkaline phosphatase family protein n=1 Tax=Amycolatopsis benzoatilytica TaxID=346045 RepID=UPI00048679BC|nr:alkaline phosphatase family protein [Amycolatopsis benzoatilytica]
MSRIRLRVAAALAAAGTVAAAVPALAAQPATGQHVLLLSVDGLHQSDLDWYTATHPRSALAALAAHGTDYSHASTPVPSDSFPGMVAQVTGGNPKTTGIYYDATYNRALLPAGTTTCAGAKPGAIVDYTEDLDRNKASIDAGQGLPGLPGGVLAMTGSPQTLLDPAALPVDPKTCKPVYPHQYLKANTVFEVAREAGYRTAWSDKHPAYEMLSGPSGTGIEDLFTPEINGTAPAGGDWTSDNASTQQYDSYKVKAVLNEIDGFDHSGRTKTGTPGVFGMNFQSVSTAQKLPASDGKTGGYQANGTPGPLLQSALDYIDHQVGAVTAELKKQHLDRSTTVILSAKHGQSPIDPAALTRIDDGKLLDGLNAAWKTAHPGAADLVVQSTDDDGMLLWFSDHSAAAAAFAKDYLLGQSGTGNGITGAAKPFTKSGLTAVHAGADAAKYFGVKPGDARVPDLIGIAQHGVVYTGGKKKIAEHGGAAADDRSVPIVVSGGDGRRIPAPVETTQIAPTILRLLHLDPRALQAVRAEDTPVLPGFDGQR